MEIRITHFLLLNVFGIATAWYKGCYKDKPDDRIFIISAGNYDPADTSPQECTYKCAVLKFTYAATQGDICLCGNNDYTKHGVANNETLCSTDCTDVEKCGDSSYVKVYETADSINGLNITLFTKDTRALNPVSFGTTLKKGANNVTYLYNFGDGSYSLTNCNNESHVYTRLGPVTVEVSARSNISGPVVARTQFYLKSALGLINVKCPEDVIAVGDENDYEVSVSQGTLMNVTWYWPTGATQTFGMPDTSMNSIGSKVSYGNISSSPVTDGTYVLPTASVMRGGHLVAWELYARKIGIIRLQVLRPKCNAGEQYCILNASCIPEASLCLKERMFSCNNNMFGTSNSSALTGITTPTVDYQVVADTIIDIKKTGHQLFTLKTVKALKVETGDVIGLSITSSGGDLAFELGTTEPEFFYPASTFNNSIGRTFARGTGGISPYNIKHVLRAHIASAVLGKASHKILNAGKFNITAMVVSDQDNGMKSCRVHVQERIENLKIVEPKSVDQKVSYPANETLKFNASKTKGTEVEYHWLSNGNSVATNCEGGQVNFTYLTPGLYQVMLNANNSVSKANDSMTISVLWRVGELKWTKPPAVVEINVASNFSFLLVSGMNVTVTVCYGDNSPCNENFVNMADNTVFNMSHTYTENGEKTVTVTATNGIKDGEKTLEAIQKVTGQLGDVKFDVIPHRTVTKELKISTEQQFEIIVSTENDMPANYTIDFGDGKGFKNDEGKSVRFIYKYSQPKTYSVAVNVTTGKALSRGNMTVVVEICGPPAIIMPESKNKKDDRLTLVKSSRYELRTKEKFESKAECVRGSTAYKWDLVGITSEGKDLKRTLGEKYFVFGPDTKIGMLDEGNYKINLTITYTFKETNRKERYYYETYITIKQSPLEASIEGGSPRDVPYLKSQVRLDASSSRDPDFPDNKRGLTYTWYCKRITPSLLGAKISPGLGDMCLNTNTFENLNDTGVVITYNSTRFLENNTYEFRLVLSKENRNSSNYTQEIRIVGREAPAPEIFCKSNCKLRVNPQERLVLEGICRNCDLTETDVTYTWELLIKAGQTAVQNGIDSYTTTGWENRNLVMKSNALENNGRYIARLTIRRGVAKATANYEVRVTSPPYGGKCSAKPDTGFAMETNYQIACQDWKTSDYPLKYEFRYLTKSSDLAKLSSLPAEQEVTTLWYHGLEHTTPFSFLPLGEVETNYTLPIFVRIYNKFGCYANFGPLNVTVRKREGSQEELKQIKSNLNKLDPKVDKVATIQWAAAASSLLNSENSTDGGKERKEEREQIRTAVVSKVTEIEETTIEGITQQGSVIAEAIKESNEVTSPSQELVAKMLKGSSDFLKSFATKKDAGAKETDESAQVLLTVASNTFKASSSTTKDVLDLAREQAIPKKEQPSKSWGVNSRNWKNEDAARYAKNVVDLLYNSIEKVCEAVQKKRVFGENATVASTGAFDVSMKRVQANQLGNTTQYVPGTVEGQEPGSFILPSSDVLFADVPKNETENPVDVQVFSFPKNPVTWDNGDSPYMMNNIIGISMKSSEDKAKEIKIKNLKEKVDIFMPMKLAQPDTRNVTFTPGKTQHYVYQLHQEEARAYPLWIEVKPQNNINLTLYLRFGDKPLKDSYNLKLTIPIQNTELPKYFRRIDDYIFEINTPKEFNSKEMHFNLSATELETGEDVQAPGGGSFTSVSTALTTNVSVALNSLSCKFWDGKAKSKWEDTGCELGNKTTMTMCHCRCNHFTLFGSVVVKPNPIGPLTLDDFVKGYALFVTVCSVFLIYFLIVVWARRKDRADTVKVGVCPLSDNDPADQYRYEITIWTGIRRGAGTKSKVSLILYGDDGDSEPRVLEDKNRKPFQRGSVDTFLLTSPTYLGPLIYTRIWHDNSGGSWKLSRIMVIDLQTDERYYFICDRWLAVDEDDGQVEKLIAVASKEELTEFQHLFLARTKRDLSDTHLWFSVVVRPPNSRFTRVQRLSCCLCLLLTAMMASAMFYDTVPEPNAQTGNFFGPVVFSWQQVFVGVVSSLIVIPVNLIVVQIFRSVRPKPVKVKHRKTNPSSTKILLNRDGIDTYGRLKDAHSNNGSDNSVNSIQDKKSRLSINDVHTDMDRASFTSSPLLHERKMSPDLDDELGSESRFRKVLQWIKSKFILPWWFVFVAWFLVFVFSAGSGVVLIMYGMRFGNAKSLQWLLSATISFVQDVLITQPIKVFGMAIFFALIIKKPDAGEFEIAEDATKLAEDEEYLNQELIGNSRTKRPGKKQRLLPPDQAKLIAMRNQRLKERKMYAVIREVLFYYFFLCVLLILVYTQKDSNGYFQTQDFVNMVGKNFTKILKKKDFWAWTRKDLLPNLFPPNGANDGYMSDGYSMMVGAARMRLIRMRESQCLVPEQIYGMTKSCVGEYFIGDDDEGNYTVGWRNLTEPIDELTYRNMPWLYQNWRKLDGYPFWGMISTYSGGGYVIILEPGRYNRKRLWELEQNLWIDHNTRAVLTEFTTYNGQSNLFTIVTLVAEFPASGGVVTFNSLQTVRLYDFTESSMVFVRCIQAVFLSFIAYFLFKSAKNLYQQGWDFFYQFWNVIEAALVLFAAAATGLYVYRYKSVSNLLERVNSHPFKFKSFQFASYWDDLYTFVMAAIVCLATLKFNRLLRFNRRMSLLSSTLKHSSFSLMMFGIVFFIVFLAYTSVAALVFGRTMFGYRTIPSSFVSLQNLMLGKMKFHPMQRANRVIGPVFFFSFMVVVSMVLVNMFLSIVIDSFHRVKHDLDKQSNEYEIVDFIIERFKLWTGIGHVRRPPQKRVFWDTAHSKVKAIQAFATQRISFGNQGMYFDNVSDLENRVEKLIERTDLLYEELFPEKRNRNGSDSTQQFYSKGYMINA